MRLKNHIQYVPALALSKIYRQMKARPEMDPTGVGKIRRSGASR